MKHKLFAIVISLALIVTMVLPGTLAIAADQDSSTGETAPTVEIPVTEEKPVENTGAAPVIAPAECSCGTETDVHSENCTLYVAPDPEPVKECTCGTETETHAENCPLYVAPPAEPEKECTCGTEDDTHAEGCPLYTTPAAESVKECTCGTADGTHTEDCPLYVAPELTLAERLLATETLEEFEAIIAEATEEELVFTCEEFDKVDAHYIYLTTGDYPNYEPVVDTVLEIVNFTNVAPFVGTGK